MTTTEHVLTAADRADLERLVASLPADVDHAGHEHGPTLRALHDRYAVGVGDLWHCRGHRRLEAAVAACVERRARADDRTMAGRR